jgi:hypothetical protein
MSEPRPWIKAREHHEPFPLDEVGVRNAIKALKDPEDEVFWSNLKSYVLWAAPEEAWAQLCVVIRSVQDRDMLATIAVYAAEPFFQTYWNDYVPRLHEVEDIPSFRTVVRGVMLSDVPTWVDDAIRTFTSG